MLILHNSRVGRAARRREGLPSSRLVLCLPRSDAMGLGQSRQSGGEDAQQSHVYGSANVAKRDVE